ncbi:hypothetical protein EX30DRAFT_373523 [Ascodesmis nigricans]|uniref:Uncharacterized protein n=1 Tax=Ascodesmis nigricans TaxID=341454 RepID=A0A4S2MNU0_9PEZI|nr:hypothetical protein EX30DRAFT_373523 [Ascodesmis nigricans]
MPPKTPRFIPLHTLHDPPPATTHQTPRFRPPPPLPLATPTPAARKGKPAFIKPSQAPASDTRSRSAYPRFKTSTPTVKEGGGRRLRFAGRGRGREEVEEDGDNGREGRRKRVKVGGEEEGEEEGDGAGEGVVVRTRGNGVEIESGSDEEVEYRAGNETGGNDPNKKRGDKTHHNHKQHNIEDPTDDPHFSTPQHENTQKDTDNDTDTDTVPTPHRPSRFAFSTPLPQLPTTTTSSSAAPNTFLSRLRAATPPTANIPAPQLLLMSPEKRRTTYTPGGLASTVATWIVQARNAFEGRVKREEVLRVRVAEAKGRVVGGVCIGEEKEMVKVVLVGKEVVREGDEVVVRWPWSEVDVRGECVRVAVFWSLERRGEEEIGADEVPEDWDGGYDIGEARDRSEASQREVEVEDIDGLQR